jgi:hypothetical protein
MYTKVHSLKFSLMDSSYSDDIYFPAYSNKLFDHGNSNDVLSASFQTACLHLPASPIAPTSSKQKG